MNHDIPFGTDELDPCIDFDPGDQPRVRCYVRGCTHRLRPPARDDRGEVCPEHGIRCRRSSAGGTYEYAEPEGNILASPGLFRHAILRHPLKFESHRLGQERSEDALSWNVFRTLQETGNLHRVAAAVTGEVCEIEPFLFLWGIDCGDEDFPAWSLLLEARRRFERSVPLERPLTEPDIALFLPGRYLILIEAKFTSKNTWYESGKRKTESAWTAEQLLATYRDPELRLLDFTAAESRPRIFHQLWRNTIFAEWMAKQDHPRTQAFHVNLVREGCEEESASEFGMLLHPNHRHRFRRMTWEELYGIVIQRDELRVLQRYLKTKSAGLKPVFRIGEEAS